MTALILQTFFILALAYLLGSLTGCFLRKFFPADHVTSPRPSVAGVGVTPPPIGTGFGAAVGAATAATGAAIAHAGTKARTTVGQVTQQIPVVKPPVQHIPTVTPPAPKPVVQSRIPTPTVPPRITIPVPAEGSSDFLTEKRDVVSTTRVPSTTVLNTPKVSDDLTKIKGLGSILVLKLNKIGITRLDQVASWTQADILNINQQLEFSGRIEREDWIGQAQRLLKGEDGVVDGTTAHVLNKTKRTSFPSNQNVTSLDSTSSALNRRVTGAADDLKRIAGVGVILESKLNEMGYTHFEHIEHLSAYDIQKISERLEFTGRIEREDWMGQARRLLGRH